MNELRHQMLVEAINDYFGCDAAYFDVDPYELAGHLMQSFDFHPKTDKAACERNGLPTDHQIFTAAIRAFGEEQQERIAVEECSELIQAISHKHRGRDHNIPEEIADVLVAIAQLVIINGCPEEVERIRLEKIERLYTMVYDEVLGWWKWWM